MTDKVPAAERVEILRKRLERLKSQAGATYSPRGLARAIETAEFALEDALYELKVGPIP